jgi:hypothetical protein
VTDHHPGHLLIELDSPPQDVREGTTDHKRADEAVYRLGLRSMPVLNMPERLMIGGVQADIVDGPVLAQSTEVRQRPGLPVRFDKHMVRKPVGVGERILLLSAQWPSVPEDIDEAFFLWRSRAQAAAGMLAAVLDERIAGQILFEDAVLLADGSTIGAMDMRERIRSFLPLEVTALDSPALAALAEIELGDGSPVARAARLYRRAALEGPTADAYVMLWVAAESLLDTRQPRKVDLDALLLEGGLDPESLPLHTGLLISLRGKIVHEGLEGHERLRTAYYEMEGIVRVLIRRAGQLRGGWWPAHGPGAYADPWSERVAAVVGRGRSYWHADGLPAVTLPGPERIPRRAQTPDSERQVIVTDELRNTIDEGIHLIVGVVSDALAWLAPDDSQPVTVDITHDSDRGMAINTERILISSERLDGLDDSERPGVLVNFVWELHGAVGAMVAMRAGFASVDDNVAMIEAVGAWHQYNRLAVEGEYDPALIHLPAVAPGDLLAVGKLAGWAAAGDPRATTAIKALDGREGELARALLEGLQEFPPEPPRPELHDDI